MRFWRYIKTTNNDENLDATGNALEKIESSTSQEPSDEDIDQSGEEIDNNDSSNSEECSTSTEENELSNYDKSEPEENTSDSFSHDLEEKSEDEKNSENEIENYEEANSDEFENDEDTLEDNEAFSKLSDDLSSKDMDDQTLETEKQENASSSLTDSDSQTEGDELETPNTLESDNSDIYQEQNSESTSQESTPNNEDNQSNNSFSSMNNLDALSEVDIDNNLDGEVVDIQDVPSSSTEIDENTSEIDSPLEKQERPSFKKSSNAESEDNNLDDDNTILEENSLNDSSYDSEEKLKDESTPQEDENNLGNENGNYEDHDSTEIEKAGDKENTSELSDDLSSKGMEDKSLETEKQENAPSSSNDSDSQTEERNNLLDEENKLETPNTPEFNDLDNDNTIPEDILSEEVDESFEREKSQEDVNDISPEEIVEVDDAASIEIEDLEMENRLRLELLKRLRDSIAEYAESEKSKPERHRHHAAPQEVIESEEIDYPLSEETNQFIGRLNELPNFENRDRGPGYAIDIKSYTDVPDSVIRTLITKFLNQRFCKMDSNLNIRSNSFEKSAGFFKWETKDMIIHLETEQLTKIPNDKYDYQYADGKNENIPLSFYFDMSGSMSNYTNMLAIIAIELLKKDVKVLIGYNERVTVQIDSISKNINVQELADFLSSYSYVESMQEKIKHKRINQNIDNFLIDAKAEKCCIFSDFDPKNEVINLSHKTQVYWFCFEPQYKINNLNDYNGFVYPVKNIDTIAAGLSKVNENRFETLVYIDNPKRLKK